MSPIHVLFVCTGNMFRSPIAQAFLDRIALERGHELTVESAGTLPGDRAISPYALDAIGTQGTDLSAHHSRLLDAQTVGRADLILGMEREHVREVVLIDPGAWPRTFTLKELVRRGREHGPRASRQSLSDWLTVVSDGRQRDQLMGWSPEDDVIDPIGGTPADCLATGEELRELVHELADLIEPRAVRRGARRPPR